VTVFQLLVEGIVVALLGVTIYYAVILNRRLAAIRAQEGALIDLVARFAEESVRADAAAVKLKANAAETEKTLRPMIEKAQALCDELAFMLDHGGALADQLDKARVAIKGGGAAAIAAAEAPPEPAPQPALPVPGEDVVGRSAAERELLRIMKGAR
jgi:hypothetical protein